AAGLPLRVDRLANLIGNALTALYAGGIQTKATRGAMNLLVARRAVIDACRNLANLSIPRWIEAMIGQLKKPDPQSIKAEDRNQWLLISACLRINDAIDKVSHCGTNWLVKLPVDGGETARLWFFTTLRRIVPRIRSLEIDQRGSARTVDVPRLTA